ncbi:hypothetical protein F2Q70_00028069 [Brassica cretica]|uniref:Uncharacterized protein n=1 Tax=Brassica cretica TaxID=69181 RepID=A0A8S9GC65_BRACR|nr:hypothetical protein F2Q68_00028995 [Brassica cretica]KAF2601110.1 hypothetical protein F2Q70_00028069 [Brassica cretica]
MHTQHCDINQLIRRQIVIPSPKGSMQISILGSAARAGVAQSSAYFSSPRRSDGEHIEPRRHCTLVWLSETAIFLVSGIKGRKKTEAKLCREFPETENPSRRALSLSPAPSLSILSLRDLSPLSLLLAGVVWWWWWWLQPIGGGGQISQPSCFLVPDLFRSPLPCLLFPDPDPDLS